MTPVALFEAPPISGQGAFILPCVGYNCGHVFSSLCKLILFRLCTFFVSCASGGEYSGLFPGQVNRRGSGQVGSGQVTRPDRTRRAMFKTLSTRPDRTHEILTTS